MKAELFDELWSLKFADLTANVSFDVRGSICAECACELESFAPAFFQQIPKRKCFEILCRSCFEAELKRRCKIVRAIFERHGAI